MRMLFWVWVDTCRFLFHKLMGHIVLLPRGEHDGESLAALLVGLEGPTLPFPYVCNDCAVISVMDRR
jgi:hypothetical protein